MQLRKSINEMPRYKIANNPEQFNVIFRLLECKGEVSNQAWGLIKTLSTNPNLYQKVLKLNKDTEFNWS
jgi:hypothetical protein